MSTIADPRGWDSRVFCMISPDCLARQLTDRVLDRFTQIGLHPAGWLLTRITTAQTDHMSELQNLGAEQAYRYRALDALFELGPVLMIALADAESRPPAHLYRAAQDLKGHSDPLKATPGSIRHDLGSINVVMNLLHVSDTPEHSARECAALGVEGFHEADLRGLLGVLTATQPAERRMFRDVLSGVRGRVIARVWSGLTPEGRRIAAGIIGENALADADATKMIVDDLAGSGLHPELAAILAAPFDSSAPPLDITDVQRCLAWHGISLDSWEKTVLTTSDYFPPVR